MANDTPAPYDIPRLFAGDPAAMEAYRNLLDHPEQIRDHLLLAGGICHGRGMLASAAAVLIAWNRPELLIGDRS